MSPRVHTVSSEVLNKWEVFRTLDEDGLEHIRCFYSFHTPSYLGCGGGSAMILITKEDQAFGIGHNCSKKNILGFTASDRCYGVDDVPEFTSLPALSDKKFTDMSIGGLIGAGISYTGQLFWWGNRDDELSLMEPHIPKAASATGFSKVACGHRMMAALTLAGRVLVWGRVFNNPEEVFDGLPINCGLTIVDLSCGLYHVAMNDVYGVVYTWGRGEEGQRGIPGYTYKHRYDVARISRRFHTSVKCGPYSTFCISDNRVLKGCGTTQHVSVGLDNAPNRLTPVAFGDCVSEYHIVCTGEQTTAITVYTAYDEFITWAGSEIPRRDHVCSLFDVFTSWALTPGLTFIRFPFTWPVTPPIKEDPILSGDVLLNLYLNEHPELAGEPSIAAILRGTQRQQEQEEEEREQNARRQRSRKFILVISEN